MNRLIDTMTEVELICKLQLLEAAGSLCNLKQELEALFAPIPCWSDNLDPLDKQTWVLCFVSADSAKDTRHVEWVSHVDDHRSVTIQYDSWKYATPVDLDLRYTKGEDTL